MLLRERSLASVVLEGQAYQAEERCAVLGAKKNSRACNQKNLKKKRKQMLLCGFGFASKKAGQRSWDQSA
jgi:hypothetical protein